MKTCLRSLKLAGYRSYDHDFDQNEIQFHDINLIIGANGAGKSNLISFLEMISYMMTSGLRLYVAKQGGAQSLLYFGAGQTSQIQGELSIHDPGEGKEDIYSFALKYGAADQLFFASEKMEYQDQRHTTPFTRDFGVGHFESGLSNFGDATTQILRTYLESLRVFHFNDTSISSRIRSNTPLADAGYLRSDGGNIAAFLYRMRQSEDGLPYYDRIVRYVRMVMPQFYDFYLDPGSNGSVNLNWRQAGGEEVFGPHQLSDGTLRFIALTTLLLQPEATAPMTIILDEPEIGLHPFAISLLAKEITMASQSSQIIVSTQSPLLLNEFSCENVITADYDPYARKSVLRRHTSEELKDWLQEYTLGELWEKNVLGGLPL